MSTRDIPKMVQAIDNTTISYTSSPAGDVRSGCSISSGTLIDRTKLGRNYNACVPFAIGKGNASTEVDAKLTLGIKLQHGDSSGGGDLADYSTQSQPTDAVFMSSAMTTSYTNWTTGDKVIQSNPGVYDLRGAKRYLNVVLTPTIQFNSTSTATSANMLRVSGGVAFLKADEEPYKTAGIGDFSSSTST